MALEELIVAWSLERPSWQRDVMRRVAMGEPLSDADYVQLVEDVVAGKQMPNATFGLEHLPQTAPESLPVRLVSIEKLEHVNALESKQPLTFDATGLTIVYGDNGSGKSGYARLLKRIARARHQEEVHSDVFRDTSLAKPTALLKVRVGDEDVVLTWPEDARPELRQMLFYDAHCGSLYIGAESDFPYRPAALFVMDRLIEACVAIRSRIDAKLEENTRLAKASPNVPEEVRATGAGKFLAGLSSISSIATLDGLIRSLDESSETIDGLKNEEASLRSTDTAKERAVLTRQGERLGALRTHLDRLRLAICDDALATIQQEREQLHVLEGAAAMVAESFTSEPLRGIGSSPWKVLWESALRFSEEQAYRGRTFPVLDDDCRCVLCQQTLDAISRVRFASFNRFVKDDTQVRLQKARKEHDDRVRSLVGFAVSPDSVTGHMRDLEASYPDLVAQYRATLTEGESVRNRIKAVLEGSEAIPRFDFDASVLLSRLASAGQTTQANTQRLTDPGSIQQRLTQVKIARMELELLQAIKTSREVIANEITRLKQREALEAAKSAAATTAITKKITELSEVSITEVVSNHFIRETDRLDLQRVTIARTRTDKGALLHQPKLVNPRQQVALPKVLSEGERTALGLAAFLTEAEIDPSRSALILDDPVTSLDHVRRERVASRLAALAEHRQVVVFTHDASFVIDLKRAAKPREVAERSVTRSRADERKPGSCSPEHPWKAKDVSERLGDLRTRLARIKRESGGWDEKTYEDTVATWAGDLSETWERIFSQEIVGPILPEGGLEVHPKMVRILARFTDDDYCEFDASYGHVSQWAKRHDKSAKVNYVAPGVTRLEDELALVDAWYKRIKKYKVEKG